MNDFILAELNSLRVSPISLDEPTPILADNYQITHGELPPT